MTDLGTLYGNPFSTSEADAINDQGQIIGSSYSFELDTTHAVYYGPSGVIDLGTLGGRLSFCFGLNNLGQVVGQSGTRTGPVDAFLTDLDTMQMVDLNDLIPPDSGWHLLWAMSINDAGQITGQRAIGGEMHAYLLTPNSGSVPGRRDRVAPAGRELVAALLAQHNDSVLGAFGSDLLSIARPSPQTVSAAVLPRTGEQSQANNLAGPMVTEIPDPNCVSAASPFYDYIANARATFDSVFTVTTSWHYPNATVLVTGVGFWDRNHGQIGAAGNFVEMHPFLDIQF